LAALAAVGAGLATMIRSRFEFVAGETTTKAEDAIQCRRPGAFAAVRSRGRESFRAVGARSSELVQVEQSAI